MNIIQLLQTRKTIQMTWWLVVVHAAMCILFRFLLSVKGRKICFNQQCSSRHFSYFAVSSLHSKWVCYLLITFSYHWDRHSVWSRAIHCETAPLIWVHTPHTTEHVVIHQQLISDDIRQTVFVSVWRPSYWEHVPVIVLKALYYKFYMQGMWHKTVLLLLRRMAIFSVKPMRLYGTKLCPRAVSFWGILSLINSLKFQFLRKLLNNSSKISTDLDNLYTIWKPIDSRNARVDLNYWRYVMPCSAT